MQGKLALDNERKESAEIGGGGWDATGTSHRVSQTHLKASTTLQTSVVMGFSPRPRQRKSRKINEN